MKKIILFLLLISSINSCCKKEVNCEPNCALPDGTFCTEGKINVNNNCECPENSFEFNNECLDSTSIKGNYLVDLNCHCLDDLMFNIQNNSINYTIYFEDGTKKNADITYTGTETDFRVLFITDSKFDCNKTDSLNIVPEFVGKIVNDTLYLKVYFKEQGPNWDNPVDSCVGYVVPII